MTRRRITLAADDRTFTMRGWRSGNIAADAGVRVIYSGAVQGWIGDRRRLADLLAFLDHRHLSYTMDEVIATDSAAAVPADQRDEPDDGQRSLFDGGGAA